MSVLNRQIGIVSVVDVGCAVWSTERRRAGAGGDTIGGVVVAVTEKPNVETGEIDRSFLVFDHVTTRPFLRWATLVEKEVDRDSIEALDTTTLKRACKRLAEEIAFTAPHQRRHGQPDPYEARCAHALAALMELVAGPDAREDAQKALNPSAMASMWRQLAEDVYRSRGVVTIDTARRAFATEELVALVYGGRGALHGELETPAPAAPAAPRPSFPPAPASMFVD